MKKKRPGKIVRRRMWGVFDETIENLESLFPDTGRLAIRALKILDGATLKGLGKDAMPFLAWGPNVKLAALMVKARKVSKGETK